MPPVHKRLHIHLDTTWVDCDVFLPTPLAPPPGRDFLHTTLHTGNPWYTKEVRGRKAACGRPVLF